MKDITAKELLQHSFVITIDNERFKWFKKVFKFHNLTPIPSKMEGVTYWFNSAQYNCYLSHKKAILTAKKLKWPYVCIFEDDAYPCNNVVEEIDKHLKELPNDCKVLALGNIMLWDVRGELGNFHRDFKHMHMWCSRTHTMPISGCLTSLQKEMAHSIQGEMTSSPRTPSSFPKRTFSFSTPTPRE